MKIEVQTAATERPLTVDEAAGHLLETRPSEFGRIDRLIDVAIESLQKSHWTQFCTATIDEYFDSYPSDRFVFSRNPVVTASSVKYTDVDGNQQTVDSSVWEQADENGRGIVRLAYNQVWPTGNRGHPDDIVIRYTAGYGTRADVPEPIRQRLLILIADLYAFPESVTTSRISPVPGQPDSLMAGYSYRSLR